MIDVVYLAYSNEKIGYGIEVVEKFLNSYKNHPAGIEHNFVIIAKNWTDKALYNKLCSLAKENNAKLVDLPDDGLDFGAYFRISKILENEYVFFLGSGIEILTDNWLLYTNKAFENDNAVQIAGPMGAWEKGVSGVFPNYHIRTCAFMINRELFLEYAAAQKFPKTKEDTWEMEHGQQSLTKFVFQKGYNAAIINSDGEIFTPENWIFSKTYISPDEFKSTLSDKWSKRYYSVNEEEKITLEVLVWGKNLTPYPKNLVNEFSQKVNIFIPYKNINPVLTTNIFHPIFLLNPDMKLDSEALQANTGINIAHKYKRYGELTGYYWIWKNYLPTADTEYVGFCQTQRFLDFNLSKINPSPFRPIFITDFKKVFEEYTEENIFNCIQDYDVVLPEKISFDMTYSKNDIDLILEVINEIYPQCIETAQEVMSSDSMYSFGNFVMKKERFNEFMEWLFNILEVIEQKTNFAIKCVDMVNSIFASEIFFNIWLMHNIKIRNLKIKTVTSFLLYFDMKEYLEKCLEELQNATVKG